MATPTPADHARILREQTQRVHIAVHSGTLDRSTVDDALHRITLVSEQLDGKTDKDDAPKGLVPPPPGAPVTTRQPSLAPDTAGTAAQPVP